MKSRTSVLLHLLFALIVVVELTGRFMDNIRLEYMVKPLIMIWIGIFFLIFNKKKEFILPGLIAYFFSWAGDNLLMFSGRNDLFFYAGVGAFFFAQLSYIYVFTVYREQKVKGRVGKSPLLILP